MDMPRGLRRPHHIAEIAPVLLTFALVVWGTVSAWIHIAETTAL